MWHGIEGHDEIVEQFRRTLAARRLASTYLFVGPSGIGKRRFALQLAESLLCTESDESSLEPCGQCDSCRMFAAGNHPDLHVESLPPGKSLLPIELFIGDREHRNQQGLCHQIALKPFFGRRKIAIVDDADHFSIPSANCLLKTLEEPPPSALLILIGTSPSRQLPTIRSRSQIVRFAPLDSQSIARILMDNGLVPDQDLAGRAAELSEGSVERALQLADAELWAFRQLLFAGLSERPIDSVKLARAIQAFVDEAGKEAVLRRDRLHIIIDFAIKFLRQQLGPVVIETSGGTESVLGANVPCANVWNGREEAIIQALDAGLHAAEFIDRNANLGLVIQNWCEELSAAAMMKGNCEAFSATRR